MSRGYVVVGVMLPGSGEVRDTGREKNCLELSPRFCQQIVDKSLTYLWLAPLPALSRSTVTQPSFRLKALKVPLLSSP